MQNDQLDGLLALKLIGEHLSFTAAARDLGVTPSAVSQAIKNLEARVGVALVARTTRSASLTEVGQRFLNQAGPALDQILAAFDGIGEYAAKPSGLLRLNMPRLIYPRIVAPIINTFTKKYPEISIEIIFEEAASDIVGGGFDAGIRLSDILIKDMVAIKIFGPARFVVVGAPAYFAANGRPKHPKDLLTHSCLVPGFGNRIYDKWEFEHKGKEFQVQVKRLLAYNDSTMLLKATSDGLGVTYTLEKAVEEQLASGELEAVLTPFAASSTGFYLYFPTTAQVLPKLRVFIDHVRECTGAAKADLRRSAK